MDQSIREDTSVDIKALEKTIRDKLGGDSSLSDTSCIFRVPEVLRRNNTKAYEPDMVAIGPLHHDREQKQYQHMEKVKRWYLSKYILSSKNVDLAKLIQVVTRDEKRARDCYGEPLDSIKSDDFREMMIFDGCFIVELFRKFAYKKPSDGSQPKEDDTSQPKDPILSMDCMIQYICHDILLLENQIPWDVLQSLYTLTQGDHDIDLPLSELILEVFSSLPSVGNNCKAYQKHLSRTKGAKHAKPKHVLDLVRTSIVYSFKAPELSQHSETRCLQKANKDIGEDIPPATTLSKGGVKFKNDFHLQGESIMSMGFEHGVWKIPQLVIGELTEPLFRNLIAYEQCSQSQPHMITSYAAVMDKLISSKEDMEFLCEKKIIRNWLSAEDGFKFFNKLYIDTFLDKFYYKELCTEVNSYYNVECVRWMENFRRNYFHTPWTIISLLAATLLLVLTLVQTIFTVHD